MIGMEIGSYKLVSKIGEGGMGEVYIAQHNLLGRKAAVKLLLKEFVDDENVVKRFINEAKATSQIVHTGIVQIFDFGKTPDGSVYMIMELLQGETLLARVRKKGRLAIADAVSVARQMADALSAAHALHVVHRDLKPENVFLVTDDTAPGGERVKILDFGIAKMLDGSGGAGAAHTKTGSILGTPIYMSPEQCLAQPKVDHRADLYSLGCVFFHLLCGRPPFNQEGIGELLGAHVYATPPTPSVVFPGVPRSLDTIVLKLLAKKPEERFQSMAEFIVALDAAPLDVTAPANAPPVHEGQGTMVLDAPELPPQVARVGSDAPTMIGTSRPRWTPPELAAPKPIAPATHIEEPLPPPIAQTPPRKEITTLGGSAGESTRKPSLPQPERRKMSTLVMMGGAFGFTLVLGLGAFFLFGRGGGGAGATGALPGTVTLNLDSDPSGAQIYRDGVLVGVTPFAIKQAAVTGESGFVLKKAGFEDTRVALPGDHDGQKRVTLVHGDGG